MVSIEGEALQFNRSAGIFVTGVWLTIGGPVLGWLGMAAMTSSSIGGLFALIGGAAGIAGSICIAVAIYRALSKIDALHVPAHPQQHAPNQMPYPPSYPPMQGQNYQQ